MNKKELNNEIILCRPAVRKAKVIVIRKILKKMKILKSCKIETLKEKKLKKSERLFKKVQIMKKIKDDDVTKFALRYSNLESYLHGPKVRLKENVLACLAKHEAVAKKVNSIREKIQNWETELPILLDSLGKKKKNSANKCDAIKGTDKLETQIEKKKKCEGNSVKVTPNKSEVCQEEPLVKLDVKASKNSRNSGRNEEPLVKPDIKKSRNSSNLLFTITGINSDKDKRERRVKHEDDSPAIDISNSVKPKKVDDPFFIDKKVIQPKLLLETLSVRNSNKEMEKLGGKNGTSMFHKKPFKVKKESIPLRAQKPKWQPLEDQLHPSWAAKKVTLIKPFEGKKIKFSEE